MSPQPPPTPPTRASRGRILLAGGGQGIARLSDELGPRAKQARNAYEALGELTTASATEPIEMVILTRDAAAGRAEKAAKSLRRVDRSVRIALLLDGAPATGAEMASFDACLEPAVRAAEVESLLAGSDAEPVAAPVREAAPAPSASQTLSPPPQPPVAIAQRNHVEATPNVPVAEEPKPIEREPLGDTDLVEAILESEDRFLELALRMIHERTGWANVHLNPVDRRGADELGAVVAYGGRVHGVLVAADAPQDEQRAWADWLARWMTLDATLREQQRQAMQDELTGAWNRRYFNEFLGDAIAQAAAQRRPVTVMVFDLDNFKQYNDRFGHAAGDEILRESVRLLNSAIRKGDRVCRIGGDEFAVVFADLEGPRTTGSAHPETIDRIAQRFQKMICSMRFPKLGIDAPGDLSISAGLATFPWDGRDPQSLLEHADQLALQSKRRGKNAITLGPGAQRICDGERAAD